MLGRARRVRGVEVAVRDSDESKTGGRDAEQSSQQNRDEAEQKPTVPWNERRNIRAATRREEEFLYVRVTAIGDAAHWGGSRARLHQTRGNAQRAAHRECIA